MVDELIKSLGGNRAVASALGVAPNVVANWRSRSIPWRRRHEIARLAAERGVELPGDFWNSERAA